MNFNKPYNNVIIRLTYETDFEPAKKSMIFKIWQVWKEEDG